VLEEDADSEAAMAHNQRAGALLERVAHCAEMVDAEVYGAVGSDIRAWVRACSQVTMFADFPDHSARTEHD
jgi:hypothetical protein